ncbi:unnamed protein product [Mucor hiemalis]
MTRSLSSVTNREHHSVNLVRSSSLAHQHSQNVPIRSKSLTLKSISEHGDNTPFTSQPPFQFLDHKPLPSLPPSQRKQSSLINPPARTSSLRKPKKKLISCAPDNEITKALLDWKRKSVFKVDWANMFSPSVELWKMNDNIFGSIEDLLNYKSKKGNEEVEIAANNLWIEKEDFVPKKEIAAYLGKLDPFCHRVLKRYLDKFDFSDLSLVEAFRKLCSKLYFKAEAQEIDRILEVFSYKYWSDNKDDIHIYKSADVVYTITYSIMLLNTDLHLVQISSHAKMTSTLFCENTVATVMEQNVSLGQVEAESWKEQLEVLLKDIFARVKSNGILQPTLEDEPKSFLKRVGSLTQRRKRSGSLPLQ